MHGRSSSLTTDVHTVGKCLWLTDEPFPDEKELTQQCRSKKWGNPVQEIKLLSSLTSFAYMHIYVYAYIYMHICKRDSLVCSVIQQLGA